MTVFRLLVREMTVPHQAPNMIGRYQSGPIQPKTSKGRKKEKKKGIESEAHEIYISIHSHC